MNASRSLLYASGALMVLAISAPSHADGPDRPPMKTRLAHEAESSFVVDKRVNAAVSRHTTEQPQALLTLLHRLAGG